MVGINIDKAAVDSNAGTLAQSLQSAFNRTQQLKAWLDATPDATLVALGYTSGEVAVLKSAITDLDQLRTIYQGGATLGTAKDFRTFAKQMYGFGF